MRMRPRTIGIVLLCAVLAACSSGRRPRARPSRTRFPSPIAPSAVPTPTSGGGNFNYGGVKLPSSAFQQSTWGFVGCSNTHDAIYGYHQLPDSAHLFWPFAQGYPIEGRVVLDWADPAHPIWARFDAMKLQYDGGEDPPLIWLQMCENIGVPSRDTYGVTRYRDVTAMLANLAAHAPTSIVVISPLQTYDPPTLCNLMGPGGLAVPKLTDFANQAVEAGLAEPGPGTEDNPSLGPLTAALVDPRDGCHPNGNPKHGPGMGSLLLGEQLADFFDNVPRT
jgi:hypothetical protein